KYNNDFLGDFSKEVNWNGEHVGFVAEEIGAIDPRLITTDMEGLPNTVRYEFITPVLAQAIQELNLNVLAIAQMSASTTATSTMATTTPRAQQFAANFFANLFQKVGVWLADANNGLQDIVAKYFHAEVIYAAEKICVGTECLTEGDVHN